MTIQEQQRAAAAFAQRWAGRGYEKGEGQIFWCELLQEIFGVSRASEFITFETQVKLDHTSFIDGFIDETKVMIEQKSLGKDLYAPIRQSDGSLLSPFQQAKRYAAELPYSKRPRWIVTCNFAEFLVYDMEQPNGEPYHIALVDLEKEYYRLQFLVDTGREHLQRELEVSKKAGEIIGVIYDKLLERYQAPLPLKGGVFASHEDAKAQTNATPEILHSLNMLCVRLVFCLYAEDAGVFTYKQQFGDYIKRFEARDIRRALLDLFKVLDQKPAERDPYLDEELAAFPYVNGGLFSVEDTAIPQFTDEIKDLLCRKASDDFDWSEISPTIFGAIFESTLNPETRRSGGMHYTSIENIHKVIDPLFLDSLYAEFEEALRKDAKAQRNAMSALHDKIAGLRFLDPACGSGNFLTETYISLRRLENKMIKILNKGQVMLGFDADLSPVKVSISQFYGIEINDFAVTVARTALWIAEHQMLRETQEIVAHDLDFLPLKSYNNIVAGNALQIDWGSLIAHEGHEGTQRFDYIMGNPPFVGKKEQSKEQKAELLALFSNKEKGVGNLDYVIGWYKKATDYICKEAKIVSSLKGNGSNSEDTIFASLTRCAFVSTNSITQGEQVPILYKVLKNDDWHIDFAYRTFRWDSESNSKAHVHCVIIGFSANTGTGKKVLYNEQGIPTQAKNINLYLLDAMDIVIDSRVTPICPVPQISYGSMPIDDGHLILEKEDVEQLLTENPANAAFICQYAGGQEILRGKERWCLWLQGYSPKQLQSSPFIMERIKRVKAFRQSSNRPQTLVLADTPYLFGEIRQPNTNMLVIPKVSSELRRYIPIAFVSPETIINGSALIIPDATLYEFGVLMSNVHNAWMRAVCGRLEMRYQYSGNNVYNNFPWPYKEVKIASSLKERNGDNREARNFSSLYLNNAMSVNETKAHLPHWHQNGKLQFVTFRLADSLPREKWEELQTERKSFTEEHPQPWDENTTHEYYKRFGSKVDEWLDAGYGSCILQFPNIRSIVENALSHFDGERYILHSYVIMPNHVHILLETLEDHKIGVILHSWKRYTANQINKLIGGEGQVWMHESFDRIIRDYEHYKKVLHYIAQNPTHCVSNTFTYKEAKIVSSLKGDNGNSEDTIFASLIEQTAQGILDARALYPDCSLADLYDEVTMPIELRKAHRENDKAVMQAYGFDVKMSESECVARLMEMYKEIAK